MNHPYSTYIESKADEYYSRQIHESGCEIQKPQYAPTGPSGETYDVYVIKHCDCWLSKNFEDLTLERKFEALGDLAFRYGLHSGACASFKRTPITYRNRPEVLTYGCDCWLSVPIRKDPDEKACPVCDKPLFFAPRAPEDTAKQACSDINCVNAHGLVDFGLPSPVEYNETPTQKENTMSKPQILTDLIIAKSRASALTHAQFEIDDFLAPFVKKYTLFLAKHFPNGYDHRDFKVDHFVSEERDHFYLTGDEEYSFGEMYVPSLNLPFDFVADPEKYMADKLAQEEERKNKVAAKKKADAQEKVDKLKEQLAKAEEALAKAAKTGDPIKTIATRNQEQKLLAELSQNLDQG